jgi:hypothetical protein
MFPWKNKKEKKEELPVIDVSLEEVRQVIKESANTLPIGISMRTFINDDHSIDFSLLKPFLKGIPKQTFYMSKETFEIFEEQELAEDIDRVQRAVDQYIYEKEKMPIVVGDPERKLSYFLIKDYLRQQPNTSLYLDVNDNMVTYRRPNS